MIKICFSRTSTTCMGWVRDRGPTDPLHSQKWHVLVDYFPPCIFLLRCCSEPSSEQKNSWRKVVNEHICWLRFDQKGQSLSGQDRGLNPRARCLELPTCTHSCIIWSAELTAKTEPRVEWQRPMEFVQLSSLSSFNFITISFTMNVKWAPAQLWNGKFGFKVWA